MVNCSWITFNSIWVFDETKADHLSKSEPVSRVGYNTKTRKIKFEKLKRYQTFNESIACHFKKYGQFVYPTYSPFLWIASPPPGHISNSESKASKWNWTKRFVIPLFRWSRRPVFPIKQRNIFHAWISWRLEILILKTYFLITNFIKRTYEILFVKFNFVSSVNFVWCCVACYFFSPEWYKFFYSKTSECKVSNIFDAII